MVNEGVALITFTQRIIISLWHGWWKNTTLPWSRYASLCDSGLWRPEEFTHIYWNGIQGIQRIFHLFYHINFKLSTWKNEGNIQNIPIYPILCKVGLVWIFWNYNAYVLICGNSTAGDQNSIRIGISNLELYDAEKWEWLFEADVVIQT